MIFSGIKKISYILNKKSKLNFMILILLLITRSVLDGFGLGLIAPFLASIGQPSLVFDNSLFIYLNNYLDIRSDRELIIFTSSSLVIYFLLKNIFIFFTTYFQAKLIFSERAFQSYKLFNYYMKAPYEFHLEHNSAELDRNIRYEIPNTYSFIENLLQIFTNAILVLSIFILLIFANWHAVIGITLIMGSVSLVILFFSNRSSKKLGEELQYSQFRLGQSLKEGFSTIIETKLGNIESFFPKKYLSHYLVTSRSQWRQVTINSTPLLIFEIVAISILVTFVILLSVQGDILLELLPIIGLFAFAFARLLPAANAIVRNLNALEFVFPAVKVVYKEFIKFSDVSLIEYSQNSQIDFSSLEFKEVDFTYSDSSDAVLKNISFKIERSETVAFIGSSGSGKSTLLNLLIGLLEPTSGKILVNGENFNSQIRDFRSLVGYVPQTINLVDSSLRENIALGVNLKDIDELRMKKVIKEACLESFVDELPDKLETSIGEDGVRLSGGQRQRLGIARALYFDPKILVFDEATSSLDEDTEKRLTEEIMNLAGKRTMIFISHRLNTIKDFSKIYQIEKGNIKKISKFEDLLI